MNKCWQIFPIVLLLSACGGNSISDVKEWMDEESNNISPFIEPIPKAREYWPVAFDMLGRLDPFDTSRFDPGNVPSGAAETLRVEMEKREERNSILEKYPLESMTLIGIMNIKREQLAVIGVDNLTQQVRVGDYLGLDFGVITEIKDNEISLREIVEDPADNSVTDRMNTLYLQTKEESK
ncbi:MAG: pilus assembly protein PilP [Betaproteobacteria bacterium]|nr:pilus assembly protein PilP [Betaproteobacteria bacterium]